MSKGDFRTLLICYIAMDNGHRNDVDFPIENGDFPKLCYINYQRGYQT